MRDTRVRDLIVCLVVRNRKGFNILFNFVLSKFLFHLLIILFRIVFVLFDFVRFTHNLFRFLF